MAISADMLSRFPLPRINPHVLGAGIVGIVLLLGAIRVLVFGDPLVGRIVLVQSIPPLAQPVSLSKNLRIENGNGERPGITGHHASAEPSLDGVEDLAPARQASLDKSGAARRIRAAKSDLPHPDKALTAPGPGGLLPIIAADGRRPAQVYARPFALPAQSPIIALVVGGLGLKKSTTLAAINDLPPQVTLSFVPYTRDLQGWINQARAAGHEVMLELPMEPFDYPQNDPGPQTLLATVSAAENTRRLEWLLSRAWGYFAVTNYMGSKFTASETALAPVLRQLRQRGVDFIYDGEARRSSLSNIANAQRLRWTTADRIIDAEPSSAAIEEQLLHLEAIAIQNGTALGAGFSWPITIEKLKSWTETVATKGYVLAPASAVLRARTSAARIQPAPNEESKMIAQSGH